MNDRFGLYVSPDYFPDVNLEDTPLYEIYQDDTTDVEGCLAGNADNDEGTAMVTGLDRKVPTPEANDNYMNSLVMLPRGNSYARRKVIGWKIDADVNAVGS